MDRNQSDEQTHADEEASFAAGFENNGSLTASTATDTDTSNTNQHQDGGTPSDKPGGQDDSTNTEQNAAPAADPFEGLPPAARELLAEIPMLRTRAETAERKATEFGGRVSSLQSQLAKLTGSTQTAADPAPAKHKLAKVEALRDSGLPEIADALEEVLAVTTTTEGKKPEGQGDAGTTNAPAEAARTPDEEVLDELRPTWAADLMSSDFGEMLATKPKEYAQRIASTSKAKDIIAALKDFDAYKAAKSAAAAPTATRNARMAAAVVPNGDGRRPARGAVVEDEDAAFEAGFNS